MKRILIAAALLVFLNSCTPAPAPTATATKQPTATLPPQPTATATEVAPSMENLPEEWKDRIDRVETMVDMQGNERTVAIQKPADPDKEPRFRVLQWDEGKKEWAPYEPQTGWAGFGDRINPVNGEKIESRWLSDLKIPDRDTLAMPLELKEGTKLPMGLLGSIYFDKSKENSPYFTFYQAYVLDVVPTEFEGRHVIYIYSGVPLASGDWQLTVTMSHEQDDLMNNVFSLDTLSMDDFSGNLRDATLESARMTTYTTEMNYWLKYGREMIGKPFIFGMMMSPESNNSTYDLFDAWEQRVGLIDTLEESNNPANYPRVTLDTSPAIVSDELWARMTGQ